MKHRAPISGVAAYQDKFIATAGYDNQLILWDAKKHESIAVGFHDHLVNQCQFSPDGKYLVSSSSDYTARLWSVPEMKLLAVFSNHGDDVEGVAFHPTKELVATTSRDHFVRVFDFNGLLKHEFGGHTQDALSVVWAADEELITSSDDGSVKRWSTKTKSVIENIDLGEIETDTIALTEKGVVIAGNDDGELIIIKNGTKTIPAHQSGVKRLCYNKERSMLVSLSYDRTMCLWKVIDDQVSLYKTAVLPSVVWARSADFLGNEKLIFATFGNQYAIYNYKTEKWALEQIGETYSKNAICIVEDNTYTVGDSGVVYLNGQIIQKLPSLCNFLIEADGHILTGGQTGELFDAKTGKVIYQHHSPLNCASVFKKNDQLYFIVGTYTGEGLVFKKQANEFERLVTIKLHDNAIKGISASNEYIYSVCATGAAAFHCIKNFKLKDYLPSAHEKIANGCAWLRDDQFVSVDRNLKLSITSPNQQLVIKTPHKNSIKCLAISKDKRFIATGGYHGLISIYHVKTKQWQSFRPTIHGVSCLAFDEKSKNFKASSYDGSVYTIPVSEPHRENFYE